MLGSGDQEREGAHSRWPKWWHCPSHSGWLWHKAIVGGWRGGLLSVLPKGKTDSGEEGWPGVSGSSLGGKGRTGRGPCRSKGLEGGVSNQEGHWGSFRAGKEQGE